MDPSPFFESPEIFPEELRDLRRSHPGGELRLVDVREPDEFAICRIEGANLVPMGTVPRLSVSGSRLQLPNVAGSSSW